MSVILTQDRSYSDVVKYEFLPEYNHCKKKVTVNDTARTLTIGTVLGKVTATGKYKVVEDSAVDGSKVAVAVVVGNSFGQAKSTVLAGATDTEVLVLYRGVAKVADYALTAGASVTAGALTTTMYTQLEAVGIDVLTAY